MREIHKKWLSRGANAGKENQNTFYAFLRPFVSFAPLLIVLFFFGSLSWAKLQDPFIREWFTLETANNESFKCIAVFQKPFRRYPVLIYAHGSGGNLIDDGDDLRQMAELGLATVSLEYDQTNEAAFASQFDSLLQYIARQKWANTNAIAWVGSSLGANCLLSFALQHPNQQPQLLVLLSGAGISPSTVNTQLLTNFHCPTLLVHAEQDEIFPLADVQQFALVLQTKGLPVKLKIIPGAPHDMKPDREVVFRNIGEYCLTHLAGKNAWQKYYSIAQWQAEAPSFWLFCLPAAAWAVGWLAWSRYRRPVPLEKIKLNHAEIALRWLAALLATCAVAEAAIHLVPPYFPVNNKTLSIASRFLVQPKERGDFEFLAAQPIWHGQKLKVLLTHAELAGYNRELINWQLDEKIYQDYVLSPVITGDPHERFNWRRPLWEEFYPRIRHENLAKDAATIVVRHLRERVTIASVPNLPHDVPAIWLRQITDKTGFEIIYVAALRSVGVPARLNSQQQAEFFDGTQWQHAPRPIIEYFSDSTNDEK